MLIMTSVPEVDTIILLNLSGNDLIHFIQTNKYFYSLYCNDCYYWRERINHELGFLYVAEKPESLTWKEWYIFWKKSRDVNLYRTLNYTPLQGYLSSEANKKISIKNVIYETHDQLLKRALEENKYVDYFLERFLNALEKHQEEITEWMIADLLQEIIPLALEKNQRKVVSSLINALKHYTERRGSLYQLNRVAEEIGKRQLTKEYLDMVVPFIPLTIQEHVNSSFIKGYIISITEKKRFASLDEFKQTCLSSLKELLSNNTSDMFLENAFNKLDRTRSIILEQNDIRLCLSKEPTSFESALKECIDQELYHRIIISYDKINVDNLICFFEKVKHNNYISAVIIIQSLCYHRYDFVSRLNFKDSSFCRDFWQVLSKLTWNIRRKEMYIYLMILLITYYRSDYYMEDMHYEITAIHKEIIKVKCNDLSSYNFHSLLNLER